MRLVHMGGRRTAVVIVVVAVVGLATAGIVIAATSEVTPVPEKAPVSSVPAAVTAAFGVFRHPATGTDSSEGVVSGSNQSAEGLAAALGRAGANVHLSRHIGPARSQMFATTGQERVCLYAEAESSCAAPSVALGGHLLTYDVCSPGLPAGHIRVSGLVLDGVSGVTLRDSSGTETSVPVEENGFTTLATGHVTDLEWTKEGVSHKEPITYPEQVETGCVSN